MSHYHLFQKTLIEGIETCGCGETHWTGRSTELDHKEARMARDVAVQKVGEWAEQDWTRNAVAMGKQIAREKSEFTSDEFWRRGLPKPREPRALGPVMSVLHRAGFIEPTDRLENTSQVLRHAAPVRIWRSRVCTEVVS